MPKFLVTFDKTAFVPNLKRNRDGFELTDKKVKALSAEMKAAGLFPEGVYGIARVAANPDDTIRRGEEIKTFVSIDLIVEADDIDEAHYVKTPGKLLAMIGAKLTKQLEGLGSSGWDTLDEQEYKEFVILGTDAESPLYWSNADGWVEREQADVFNENEMRRLALPMGGEWAEIAEDDIAPAPTL